MVSCPAACLCSSARLPWAATKSASPPALYTSIAWSQPRRSIMIAKAVRCLSGRDLREFGRARLQCWQSSRSSSSPPLRSPPIPLAVALPQTFPQAPLGVHGVKYRTPSRRNMLVVPPSATLERRRADHGLSPAACLFRNHVIAASSNQIGRRGLGIPEPRGRRRYVRP